MGIQSGLTEFPMSNFYLKSEHVDFQKVTASATDF